MSWKDRLTAVLICVPLVVLLYSAHPMITFSQEEDRRQIYERKIRQLEIYEPIVHEAGFARATVAVIGMLLVFIPFRRGQPWSWLALLILMSLYLVPTFVLPFLLPFRGWHVLYEGIRTPGLARLAFLNLFFQHVCWSA